jgi:hypothetical protein
MCPAYVDAATSPLAQMGSATQPQFKLGLSQVLQKGPFYYATSTAFQTTGVLPSLRRNPPRLNWPL